MDEDLPTEFDLIVVGTGLAESIVAAAASRIGKTVLHLDSNEYYGGFWSSFNLEALRKYVEECRANREGENPVGEEGFLPLTRATFVENVSEEWFRFEEGVEVDGWSREKILKEFRRFNVDLAPKLLYSRGSMVELLISSNICRYAEFRAVDRVATIWNGRIMTVPCSRSDVFTSRDVNVVEKRLLMKFLQSCASFETDGSGTDEHRLEDIEGKTFLEYLKSHKLTPNLIHYLLYTIAMGNDRTSCREGLEGVKKFLLSLGRYGNSPFLFPMYGCGEIPQCFCRLCAVFGGIYCLSKSIEGINFKHSDGERSFQSLRCGQQTIEAKNLVIGQGYISKGVFSDELEEQKSSRKGCGGMARGVFLTSVPLGGASQNTGGGGVSLMKLPPVEGHEDGATIIQLAHFSGTCPKEIYLIHITARAISDDPRADLEPYVTQILSHEAPKPAPTPTEGEIFENTQENTVSTILYQLYFTIPACVSCKHNSDSYSSPKLPRNLHLACGPLLELDYDESIARAQRIFKEIYPEEEFLPRAPDPEQIIIGDEEDQQQPEQTTTTQEEEEEPKLDKVESGRECRESESQSSSVPVTPSGGVPPSEDDAQEAKEDEVIAAVEKAEECVEQK